MKKRPREHDDDIWEDSTAPAPKKMKILENSSIQKLHANQIVTSLTNVVKELLENSLDASATTIGNEKPFLLFRNSIQGIWRFLDRGCW